MLPDQRGDQAFCFGFRKAPPDNSDVFFVRKRGSQGLALK